MTEQKANNLRLLRDTLRFHQAMGIDFYPNNPDVQKFLQPSAPSRSKPAPPPKPAERPAMQPDAAVLKGIENLEQDINNCALCRLAQNQLGRVPGRGRTGSRLMIVGDWSRQQGSFSPDALFGQEEDVMLWKMMEAIGLSTDHVYVTNCLKCCPADPGEIEKKCEDDCFSFLAREIAAVNPRAICAMGDMAARILMARKDPLFRLRGRFGTYRYQSGANVAVMPTFHPRFLLQHPDMKKATWNDLQAIRKLLEES